MTVSSRKRVAKVLALIKPKVGGASFGSYGRGAAIYYICMGQVTCLGLRGEYYQESGVATYNLDSFCFITYHPELGWQYGGTHFTGTADQRKGWVFPHTPQGMQFIQYIQDTLKAQLMPHMYVFALSSGKTIAEAVLETGD